MPMFTIQIKLFDFMKESIGEYDEKLILEVLPNLVPQSASFCRR
jgi:hypothetical protein